jgi:hypothetical protein
MATGNQADMILSKMRKARNKRQAREMIMTELDAFDRNQQWDLENAPPWLPKPVTNFVHLVKYTKRAALSIDNPTGKLRPASPAGATMVDELDKGFQYVWERIKARKVVRQNIETAKLLGTAIAHVHWEENKEGKMGSTVLGDKGYSYEGEICIREVDPATFYPDPSAFCLDDCQFIGVKERKSMNWIKSHPKFKGVDLTSIDDKNDPLDRGEIYNRDYTTEQSDGLVTFISFYEKKPNEAGGYNYTVTYLAGNKILHSQPVRPNRYPFAILYDYPQRQDFWAMSTCEFILDNQKIINKVESIIAMIGTLMQNPQKVVHSQSGINPKEVAKYGNAPGQTWSSNMPAQQAITYIEPPQIPQVLFNLLENAKANIREITGMSEAYMGQAVGSMQTSGGVNSLIERATIRDKDQMYDIELYIEQLTILIIDFMVTYYDKPRMIRVMGSNGNPNDFHFEQFIGTDYKNLEYDIFIDVSSKAPITRMKEAQDAKELLNMQGQYNFNPPVITSQEAMKRINFAGTEEIIERMNQDEINSKGQELQAILQNCFQALSNGLSPHQVQDLAMQQLQQMEQQGSINGTGSTSNSNNVQMQQSGTNVGQ